MSLNWPMINTQDILCPAKLWEWNKLRKHNKFLEFRDSLWSHPSSLKTASYPCSLTFSLSQCESTVFPKLHEHISSSLCELLNDDIIIQLSPHFPRHGRKASQNFYPITSTQINPIYNFKLSLFNPLRLVTDCDTKLVSRIFFANATQLVYPSLWNVDALGS